MYFSIIHNPIKETIAIFVARRLAALGYPCHTPDLLYNHFHVTILSCLFHVINRMCPVASRKIHSKKLHACQLINFFMIVCRKIKVLRDMLAFTVTNNTSFLEGVALKI